MSTTIDDPKLEAPPAETTEAPEVPETPPSLPGLPLTPIPSRDERPLTKEEIYRPALGALMTVFGGAFMIGGMFTGIVTPRLYAAIGGAVGVSMAVWAARAEKRAGLVQVASLLGVFAVGLILLAFGGGDGGGPSAISSLGETIGEAVADAQLNRPPVAFQAGWRVVVPWTLGLIGYAAASVGSLGRKPAVGLLVPLPFTAFAAIAQPPEAQAAAGIIAFVSFVIGLAIIYRADRGEGEGVSTAYELKRAARTAPLVVVLIAALVALSQTNLLFPEPIYDPTQQAQLPKAVPLSGVRDRVLFETQGEFTGPWRTGILGVYDGESWRLPPFAEADFQPVPLSGQLGPLFNNPVPPQVRVTVTLQDLEGAVLPLPARMNALRLTDAPPLVTTPLSETVRVEQGEVPSGLEYEAVFALLPTEEQLTEANTTYDPAFLAEWTDTAGLEPPPAVVELLAEAPQTSLWEKLDFLRKAILDTVVAAGGGLPEPIPPSKVQDMLAGKQEGSPFDIVAAQALLARWAGVPARIGYGFDGGEKKGAYYEFRPLHGASWLEVYFPGRGWFPITGLPKRAKQLIGEDSAQRDVIVLPSEEIVAELFLPLRERPGNALFKQIQKVFLLALPFVVAILMVWVLWPVVVKARRKTRRHEWALQHGRAARMAVAYAEFRDLATDLGVGDPYETPLGYLDRVVPDEEHQELAWLITRCLWGDMRDEVTDDEVFAAEELSRSLRRRVFEAQPFTIRGISYVSRLSLRNPYAPELLSPAIEKVELGRLLRKLIPHKPLSVLRPRKKKEPADEAVDIA